MTDESAPEMVPTRPLRNWLLAWQLWTGDPPSVIANGLGLDAVLVSELLADGHPRMLSVDVADAVADVLGVPADRAFGRGGCDALWSELPERLASVLRHS